MYASSPLQPFSGKGGSELQNSFGAWTPADTSKHIQFSSEQDLTDSKAEPTSWKTNTTDNGKRGFLSLLNVFCPFTLLAAHLVGKSAQWFELG